MLRFAILPWDYNYEDKLLRSLKKLEDNGSFIASSNQIKLRYCYWVAWVSGVSAQKNAVNNYTQTAEIDLGNHVTLA